MKMGSSSSRNNSGNLYYPLYEHSAQYDMWLKLLLGFILALTLVLGVVLLSINLPSALVLFGVTVFDGILFYAIMPRRYEIFEDRLRVILGSPFNFSIPFSTINEVRSSSISKAFALGGLRFATSWSSIVEIVRNQGWNMVISPADKDAFLEHITQAIKASKSHK